MDPVSDAARVRPTPGEARELALAALEDRTGLPLVDRVAAAILAGAAMAIEDVTDHDRPGGDE